MAYTAPSGPLPISPCGVVVTATSNQDNTTSGQALVNVHVVVNIAAAPSTIGQRANLQYSATVTGAPLTTAGQDIQWSASNGGAFDNPIYNNGLYVAPPLTSGEPPISVTIQATSSFDPTQTASVPITVEKADPLGTIAQTTAASAQITCPTFTGGSTGATCYQLKVTCDAIADYYAYLKVNTPAGTPAGTVILGTGTGGTSLYDNDPSFVVGGLQRRRLRGRRCPEQRASPPYKSRLEILSILSRLSRTAGFRDRVGYDVWLAATPPLPTGSTKTFITQDHARIAPLATAAGPGRLGTQYRSTAWPRSSR